MGEKKRFSCQRLSNSRCMTGFYSCHKTDKTFEEFVWFSGRCLKIRDVCMYFEPYFKFHNLVKWPISTWSFIWWCQFIDWLKFETRPSSLLNFGTANTPLRVVFSTLHSVFENVVKHSLSCLILPQYVATTTKWLYLQETNNEQLFGISNQIGLSF